MAGRAAQFVRDPPEAILAPMVRVGTLPMRLLALRYGADLVYTEELIDWKILRSVRKHNRVLGTVDFVDQTDGTVVFRTCERERDRVVLQLGTACPDRALRAAKMVEGDVAGVDVNMGCPKEFSVKGGMGVALLERPDVARSVLVALVDNLGVPVSCKIRIFPTPERTLEAVENLASAGIWAVAVHGRTRDERPRHPVHADVIRHVAANARIPVIANGGSADMETRADVREFGRATGCRSVMVARAAERNCSVFREEGPLPLDEVIVEYLRLAVDYDNPPSNTKYCVQNMLRDLQDTPRGREFLACQTLRQICSLWGLGDYCAAKERDHRSRGIEGRWEVDPDALGPPSKRERRDELDGVDTMKMRFVRANYPSAAALPKSVLHSHAARSGCALPTYETRREEKLFRSVVAYRGRRYASTFWEKNRKFAEQGGALVCLCSLGLVDGDALVEEGSLLRD